MSQPTAWPFPLPTTVNGPTLRSNLNDGLDALLTLHSGAAEPNDTFPRMFWADTTNLVLKQRNAADSAWNILGPLNARWDWSENAWTFAGIAATVTVPIWIPPAAAYAQELVIQSDTSTAGSTGSNRYEIQVTNRTAANNLLATPYYTNTAEIVLQVGLVIPFDQNRNLAANDYLDLVVTKTGAPTDLSTAKIRATLRGYMRGA